MSTSDWSVVATCSEPRRLVEAFVAHHLALGAERIFLFFDDPHDGLAEAFSGIPGVMAIACDEDYWAQRLPRKGRPGGHRQRQTHNAEHAARQLCATEWLAHIDVDEFLFPRAAGSIETLLSQAPEEVDAVRLLPAERLFLDGYEPGKLHLDGCFKLKPPHHSGWGETLFGAIGMHFPNGFQGHEVGKSFKRCRNREARFNIHFVRQNGVNLPEHKVPQEQALLLHMFPASFEDWRYKFERRVEDPEYFASMPRHAQERYGLYAQRRRSGGEEGVLKLFDSLSVLPSDAPALRHYPDRFLQAELAVEKKAAELVRPYVQTAPFEHRSAPASQPVPEHQRIFQIGMNRAGSKDICAMAGRRGISYVHWDRGQLAMNLLDAKTAGRKPFASYEHYQLLSDLSFASRGAEVYDGFYDIDYILRHFPKSIYVLNHRPLDEWLTSRRRFRGGKLVEEHRQALELATQEAVLERWKSDWEHHLGKVRDLGRRGKLRLIEYSLNTEKPSVFFKKLERMLNEPASILEEARHDA